MNVFKSLHKTPKAVSWLGYNELQTTAVHVNVGSDSNQAPGQTSKELPRWETWYQAAVEPTPSLHNSRVTTAGEAEEPVQRPAANQSCLLLSAEATVRWTPAKRSANAVAVKL